MLQASLRGQGGTPAQIERLAEITPVIHVDGLGLDPIVRVPGIGGRFYGPEMRPRPTVVMPGQLEAGPDFTVGLSDADGDRVREEVRTDVETWPRVTPRSVALNATNLDREQDDDVNLLLGPSGKECGGATSWPNPAIRCRCDASGWPSCWRCFVFCRGDGTD